MPSSFCFREHIFFPIRPIPPLTPIYKIIIQYINIPYIYTNWLFPLRQKGVTIIPPLISASYHPYEAYQMTPIPWIPMFLIGILAIVVFCLGIYLTAIVAFGRSGKES